MTQPPGIRLQVADGAILLLFGLTAMSPLSAAYGSWHWAAAAGGGILAGLGVAAISRRFHLGAWLTALTALVAYLLLGSALAVPSQATAGVLPNPSALRSLLTGLIHAWRDSLTMLIPLKSGGTALVVPFVTGLVVGLVGALILWRSSKPGFTGLVVVAAFVVAAAFGSKDTEFPVLRGIGLAAALLVWHRWRATRDARVAWGRRLALTTAVVAVASGAGFGLAVAGDADRDVLREHVEPPFDPLAFPSPLSRYRAFYDEAGLADRTLFTTTGMKPGDRIRLATMDTYDGVVWNVAGGPSAPSQSGSFTRFVSEADAGGEEVTLTVGDYSGPWIPTIGQTLAAELDKGGSTVPPETSGLLINRATGTMAQLGGVQPGTTYRFRVQRDAPPADASALPADLGAAQLPPDDIPALSKRAQRWIAQAGSPTGGALAQTLVEEFRKGYYSDGKKNEAASRSGHTVKRIVELVAPEDMIGNDEQYAAAMGVVGQLKGLPTRVVMGFLVEQPDGRVLGKDVDAWVEVKLEGAGWVTFVPTPDKDRKPRQLQKDPDPEPQPTVLQPPIVPEEPDGNDDKAPQGAGRRNSISVPSWLTEVLRYTGYGAAATVVVSPLWGPIVLKRVRRRRRRGASDPLARVTGGWHELSDAARDLGTRLPASNTRLESSYALAGRFPEADTVTLARAADRHVFGGSDPSEEEAAAYWRDVDSALKRIRKAVPWWRRPVAAVSVASLPWRSALRAGSARVGRVVRIGGRPLWAAARRISSFRVKGRPKS
ncbi:MAG: transglutaminaseTgpA domain-containing protein [Nocardioides sp.]